MNKKSSLPITLIGFAAISLAAPIQAAIEFDQNVTPEVIFGSGNSNGSFTTDRRNGIEIGLRGKLRHDVAGAPQNIFNSNGDGTYFFNNIVGPTQTSPTAEWSFEWSVNTDHLGTTGLFLDDFSYELGVDNDAGLGTSFTTFDNISPSPGYWDHAIGNNLTVNGGGTSAGDIGTYLSLISSNNVSQNSWKYHWFASPFDPTVVGTYAIYLLAKDSGGVVVARSDIQVLVGGASAAGPILACDGFKAPLDADLSLKKPNRVLPLKMALFDGQGDAQTDDDITANPVLQVSYDGVYTGSADLEDLDTAGKGGNDNMLVFKGSNWGFNMKTKGLVSGSYTISVVSGNLAEYVIDPTCEVKLTIQ